MKYLLLFVFISLTSFHTAQTKVYICGPSGEKKYHYLENCRGLTACKQKIVKTSIPQAKAFGLSLCGWED
jgi:hypothetical protein